MMTELFLLLHPLVKWFFVDEEDQNTICTMLWLQNGTALMLRFRMLNKYIYVMI